MRSLALRQAECQSLRGAPHTLRPRQYGAMPPPRPAELMAPGTEGVWREAGTLGQSPDAGAVERLRRAHPNVAPQIVSAIITQAGLRRQARGRFGPLADRMLFTVDGLQQSTRPFVAARRAQQLAERTVRTVADLGCGIGSDSLAFQRSGLAVTAVEADPDTAVVAEHNLGQPVVVADLTAMALPDTDAVFLDPARRVQGARLLPPETWKPPWSWILDFAAGRPATVVKASPGLPHGAIPNGAAVEWISVAGSLVETCVWFPGLSPGMPRRRAVMIRPGTDPWTPASIDVLAGDHADTPAATGPLGSYVFEPDPAVIRSHLIDVLAQRLGAHLLSSHVAYLSGDTLPRGAAAAQCFAVHDTLPAGARALGRELRHRGIGRVEIHTRGLGVDPAVLRRRLALKGGGPVAHLILTRVDGRSTCLLVAPLPGGPGGDGRAR